MLKKYIVVTNNIDIVELLKEKYDVEFVDSRDQLKVLENIRSKVHMGYVLETHPISGSIKPNETPYKTVVLSASDQNVTDMQSLLIAEDAIMTYNKFVKNKPVPDWTDHVLQDFRDIDTSLMMSNIGKMI